MANKSNWKNLERIVAEKLTGVLGYKCLRNPLSGANSANDKGERRGGDVIIHSDFKADFQVECKVRASHAHHTLYRIAALDSKKHKFKHTLLFTKTKGETGHLVTMDAELLYSMLEVPGVRELLKKTE